MPARPAAPADPHDVDTRRTFERLLRKVMSLPARPAVVLVHIPTKGQAFDAQVTRLRRAGCRAALPGLARQRCGRGRLSRAMPATCTPTAPLPFPPPLAAHPPHTHPTKLRPHPTKTRPQNEFKRGYWETVEDIYSGFSTYYQVPTVSLRQALPPATCTPPPPPSAPPHPRAAAGCAEVRYAHR